MTESDRELIRALAQRIEKQADQISDAMDVLVRIDERLDQQVKATDKRDEDHSERINAAASQAALTATKVADWESKIRLLIWLVSFFGVGGAISFASVVAKGMLK